MDAPARLALTDKGGQSEAFTAPLTESRQTAARERLIAQASTMGLANKLNKFPAFRKWT